MTTQEAASSLGTSAVVVEKWARRFCSEGVNGLYPRKPERPKKHEDPALIKRLFAVLHSPPTEHGINRTSWHVCDLKRCLGREGLVVSETAISRILKGAGYRWRRAREVLTSPDPDYRPKLEEIATRMQSFPKTVTKLGDPPAELKRQLEEENKEEARRALERLKKETDRIKELKSDVFNAMLAKTLVVPMQKEAGK